MPVIVHMPLAALKNQIGDLILERIGDREHADVYNSMISKRETEVAELEQKIVDNQKYNEVSRQKHDCLKSRPIW